MWLKLWKQANQWLKSIRKRDWLMASFAILIITVVVSSPIRAVVKQQIEMVRNSLALMTANIKVTALPLYASPGELLIYYISDYQVGLVWGKPEGAVTTMVRASVGRYPEDRETGYQVYFGERESVIDTGVSLDETAAAVYYRVWFADAEGTWLEIMPEGYIEGIGMTLLAEAITEGIKTFFPLLIMAFLVGLVFWQKNPVLYALAVPVTITYGLSVATNASNSSPLWVAGIVIALIGMYCLFKVIMIGLERSKEGKKE